MNPEISVLEELLEQLLRGIQETLQSGEILSDEFQGLLAQEISNTTNQIDQLRSQQAPQGREPFQGPNIPTINEAPPTGPQQLLWILSGQNEDVFRQYLQTYPDPSFRQLLQNEGELERVIEHLHAMMPPGQPPEADGIQHADLNSSNIYGFRYDPQSKKLLVKFQGNGASGQGPVYSFEGVPQQIYNTFASGAIPARTEGQNRWGRWWRGKQPSLGSSFFSLIRNGGYPYRRMS